MCLAAVCVFMATVSEGGIGVGRGHLGLCNTFPARRARRGVDFRSSRKEPSVTAGVYRPWLTAGCVSPWAHLRGGPSGIPSAPVPSISTQLGLPEPRQTPLPGFLLVRVCRVVLVWDTCPGLFPRALYFWLCTLAEH